MCLRVPLNDLFDKIVVFEALLPGVVGPDGVSEFLGRHEIHSFALRSVGPIFELKVIDIFSGPLSFKSAVFFTTVRVIAGFSAVMFSPFQAFGWFCVCSVELASNGSDSKSVIKSSDELQVFLLSLRSGFSL